MSSNVPPPGADDGPSEEEVRQYLAQMRGAPADQVVVEVIQGLLNAAQVKLGRNDARLLLDATAAVTDAVRGRVTEDLTGQVDQALSQLRLAQVEAEREVAQAGQPEPNDLPASGGPAATGAGQAPTGGAPAGEGQAPPPPPQQSPPPQQPSQTSKLWLPGQ